MAGTQSTCTSTDTCTAALHAKDIKYRRELPRPYTPISVPISPRDTVTAVPTLAPLPVALDGRDAAFAFAPCPQPLASRPFIQGKNTPSPNSSSLVFSVLITPIIQLRAFLIPSPPNMARRQDTFDLRSQLQYSDADDSHLGQSQVAYDEPEYIDASPDDEDQQHSMIDVDEEEDRFSDEDDDRSSSLSIPNESIDFDLVYSLHSFAATVEGQASVVKGDSLVLMDDTNSYWWLVRVLKTQEIGYIPAENIETPFERLARLNRHRNVDVCKSLACDDPQSNALVASIGNPGRIGS